MTTNIKDIRDRIMRERGIAIIRSDVSKHRRIERATNDINVSKTPLMRYLEVKYEDNIVNILSSGSLSHIEKKYKIDRSTASKWKKRIMLELMKQISTPDYGYLIKGSQHNY